MALKPKALELYKNLGISLLEPKNYLLFLAEYKNGVKFMEQAYKEVVPHFMGLEKDQRIIGNTYYFNADINTNPVFMVASKVNVKAPSIVNLTCIYISPEYRRKGLASVLLEMCFLKSARCHKNAIFQASIDSKDKGLAKFYLNNGFVCSGYKKTDDLGIEYEEYFYCLDDLKFTLPKTPSGELKVDITTNRPVENSNDKIYS